MNGALKGKNILVANANPGLTFGILRILNKMGIKPIILGPNERSFLLKNKFFCSKYIGYNVHEMGYDKSPTISSLSDRYIHLLNDVCKEHNIDLVLPVDYTVILPLSKYSNLLNKDIKIAPYLDEARLRDLNSKWNFSIMLKELGIPQPETRLLEKAEQANSLDLEYPIIVKPLDRGGSCGIKILENKDDLKEHVSANNVDLDVSPLLCQKFLPGRDLQVFAFASKGKLLAWSMCYMEGKGFREFVDEPNILEYCRKILEKTEYDGPGLIDIRHDTQNNTYNFLEINLRFPASTLYHYMAGVNYIELALLSGLGEEDRFSFSPAKHGKTRRTILDSILLKVNMMTTPPF